MLGNISYSTVLKYEGIASSCFMNVGTFVITRQIRANKKNDIQNVGR